MSAESHETSAPAPSCPGCGAPARAVGLKTVKHLLDFPQSRAVSGEGWLFCPKADCDAYYFRAADLVASDAAASPDVSAPAPKVYRAADIKQRARPHAQGSDRLVCYCFGYTVGDIATDARGGRNEIPSAIAAEVRAGMCACEVLNPGGG